MKRQGKYPETNTFHYHNANPKNKNTGDCVLRAISTALDKPYLDVLDELVAMQKKTGYQFNCMECYTKYLETQGFVKMPQPKKSNNKKYTGKEFCESFKGTCVAKIGGHHIVCIKDGKVHDTWDSTSRCIGNYWVKK